MITSDGPVVTFSHGWPLSADQWDAQMVFLNQHGFRTIAHDRRGHGRSSQPSSGNNMDTYADDLAELIEGLDLRDVTVVGHSTGGGEVARYIGRHGTARVAKAVLISAVPPHLAPTADDPVGLPKEAFDWYLDLRKYGSVPHAGFGMGIERCVTWICGIDHLRETIAFPRMLYRLRP